ncbi:MAG: LD-carboxypeptidase [Bacteroidota bacterium]|nr:LD-carboxypeptidase [Bacteroidota bacterium]
MNRKDFLSSIIPIVAVTSAVAGVKKYDPEHSKKIPPYLKKGDTIGITCPAGFITLEDVQPCVNKMKEWGFEIKIGNTVGARDFTFAGTDEERRKDLQAMLDDDSVNAIMFGRGGYGAVRIIDKIDFKKFVLKPKWLIGFSDVTVFHSHLNKNFGIASIHSKMCNSFPSDWSKAEPSQIETIDSIRKCLTGEKMQYSAVPNEKNRTGFAEGVLVGGNLSLIESLASSKSDIDTAGKILFLEEVGEYLYSIDRMFWYLKRAGKLDKLKALIICGFKVKPDDAGEEFGRTVYEIVNEVVKEFSYPVCFDFPVGHQKNNFALKCSVKHRLEISNEAVTLKEV